MRNKTPLRGFLARRVRNESDTRAIFPSKKHPRCAGRSENSSGFIRWNAHQRPAGKVDSSGFTITELLIVIILTGLLTLLIMVFAFDLWRTSAIQEADIDTLVTRFNASDKLREEIGTSSGLIIQNGIPDTHAMVPDSSIPGNTYWTPIHAIPSTTTVGGSGVYNPLIYFRHYSVNNSNQYIMNGSQPYEDEYVLYLDGSKKALMQRNLANPSASGDKLVTTCPDSAATPLCPADKTIATDIASVSLRYFSRTGNTIDYTSITDPNTGAYIGPDFPAVEVMEFTLNLSKKAAFSSTNAQQNSTIIRIALRNS